jgi:GTP-binding protein HflX
MRLHPESSTAIGPDDLIKAISVEVGTIENRNRRLFGCRETTINVNYSSRFHSEVLSRPQGQDNAVFPALAFGGGKDHFFSMFGATGSLLPIPSGSKSVRALNVGFIEESMDEMDRLGNTLGLEMCGRSAIALRKVDPSTYISKGKLEEVQHLCHELKPDAVIIDKELSPNQLKNIEDFLKVATIDRPGVIIEIFSRHARTREAKTQVELARVEYILPRLAHLWSHLDRQRGGGVTGRGMGEKQMEADRRMLKAHVVQLKKRLKSIERVRGTQRAGRSDVLKVALVGYTNAGKSTLLNGMTKSEVLAENKLFATLDSSIRALDPDSKPPVVAVDTVGFIDHLPPALIASFRSTLEELHDADLLLHVVDGSSERAAEQMQVTVDTLKELGLEDKPRLVVINKMDQVKGIGLNRSRILEPGAIRVSALSADDLESLRQTVLGYFREQLETFEMVIPYTESKLDAQLRQYGSVEQMRYLEKGTFYQVKLEERWLRRLGLDAYLTGDAEDH